MRATAKMPTKRAGRRRAAPSEKRRSSAETRAQLLDAAEKLSRDIPVNLINVQDVTERVGISRATFYLYYSNISEIFVELAQGVCDQMMELSGESWLHLDTRENIEVAMREYITLFRRREDAMRITYGLQRSDERVGGMLLQTRFRFRKRIERQLAAGIKAGTYRKIDPKVASDALHSMMEGFCVREMDEGRKHSTSTAVATLSDLWFHAIIPEPDAL